MSQQDFALFTTILAGALALCTWLGARGRDAPADVRLMGGTGLAMGAISALLWLA